jgi:hypothetical protein
MHRRRPFVVVLLLLFVAPWLSADSAPEATASAARRVGIFADLRAYDVNAPTDAFEMVNSAERLRACVDSMNGWGAELLIELGDFVSGQFVLGGTLVDAERIPEILSEADAVYAGFDGSRYYVLGNHDVGKLTKDEFLECISAGDTTHSFDAGGNHFILFDAQFEADGTDQGNEFWYMQRYVPPRLLDWLRADLAATDLPTIACLHQRLDVGDDERHGGPGILNCLDVRGLLVDAGNVVVVFQGHDHGSGYSRIDGIHYVTFTAWIGSIGGKPPTWAYVTLDPRDRTSEGVGEQPSYILES